MGKSNIDELIGCLALVDMLVRSGYTLEMVLEVFKPSYAAVVTWIYNMCPVEFFDDMDVQERIPEFH